MENPSTKRPPSPQSLKESGKITHFIAVKQDVTKRVQTEQSLQQATRKAEAANQAKSDFLATMSHEIRTPLNVVEGYA